MRGEAGAVGREECSIDRANASSCDVERRTRREISHGVERVDDEDVVDPERARLGLRGDASSASRRARPWGGDFRDR